MKKYLWFVLAGIMLGGCASYTATSGRVVIKDDGKAADKAVEIRLIPSDRALIKDYYRKSPVANTAPRSMPLIRGGNLLTDVKVEPLPPVLERKLSSLPTTHVRWITGRDVILAEKKTRTIVDAIYDVTK